MRTGGVITPAAAERTSVSPLSLGGGAAPRGERGAAAAVPLAAREPGLRGEDGTRERQERQEEERSPRHRAHDSARDRAPRGAASLRALVAGAIASPALPIESLCLPG